MYDVNLYPPIFNQSYMPAFEISKTCKVYFQISPLNTLNDLYHIVDNVYSGIQVSVRKQSNNDSALSSRYTNEIMLTTLQIDNDRKGNDKYFIEITNSDMQNGFNLNEYYKVQIRFTSSQVTGVLPDATSSAFRSWLTANLSHFSEWSSIALIRGISTPNLNLTVNGINAISTSDIQISSDYVQIRGSVSFGAGDSERLQKYRVLLYNGDFPFVSDPDETVGEVSNVEEDSGDIYAENNLINYDISTSLLENNFYRLRIILTTNNLYQFSPGSDNTITLGDITPMPANVELEQQVNNNIGCIRLILKRSMNYISENMAEVQQYYVFIPEQDENVSLGSSYLISGQAQQEVTYDSMWYDEETVRFDPYWQRMLYYDEFNKEFLTNGDTIIIRRSSSINNFKTWKFLTEFKIKTDDVAEVYWDDYTAEPGVWYRYQVIRSDSINGRTAELVTDINKPVMLDTGDIFLNSNGEQLILKFDPSISSFSNKIAESVTDTIGSKYPFIRRNGNINYRTFSLSGTISCFMDVQSNVFNGSEENLYGESAHFYKQYNNDNNINLYNNFIYERHFRQKVMRFLQSSNIKLLRSVTEGNILVKLSNISFTPNQTLGRKIWSFSCTAYEIADNTEENYIKYNIIKDNLKVLTKVEVEDNSL